MNENEWMCHVSFTNDAFIHSVIACCWYVRHGAFIHSVISCRSYTCINVRIHYTRVWMCVYECVYALHVYLENERTRQVARHDAFIPSLDTLIHSWMRHDIFIHSHSFYRHSFIHTDMTHSPDTCLIHEWVGVSREWMNASCRATSFVNDSFVNETWRIHSFSRHATRRTHSSITYEWVSRKWMDASCRAYEWMIEVTSCRRYAHHDAFIHPVISCRSYTCINAYIHHMCIERMNERVMSRVRMSDSGHIMSLVWGGYD